MKQSFIQKGKELLAPIQYVKKEWSIFFILQIRNSLQAIFVVQVGVYIIAAVEQKNSENVIFGGMILGAIFVIGYIASILGERIWEYLDNHIEFCLRKKYFKKYIMLDNTKVEEIGTGKMQNIILQGIGSRSGLVSNLFTDGFLEVIAIIYAFGLIANQAPSRGYFISFTLLACTASSCIRIGLQKISSTRKKSKEINIELSRQNVKILMSKFEILQNNKLDYEMNTQQKLVKENIRIWQKGNLIKMLRQTGANIILDGLQVYIYIAVGLAVITENYTFAYMMLLLQLVNIISKHVWSLRGQLRYYYSIIVDIEKLQETFATIPSVDYSLGKEYVPGKKTDIMVDNISFGYDKKSIFKDFSLHIKGGTKTAFVGESGGGKTTLIKLLAGYIAPDKGQILIDGQRIAGGTKAQKKNNISLQSYYKHIGYLTQDPSVFDGTIYENLVYALDTEPSKKDIEKVIRQSKCEFVLEFEKGLETEIGERGVRLSGGQKQRLAIAKIMLKNPEIILLDEPTSALDSFNEEQINIALHNLFKGKTVIVIAHRLQTVKEADKIILFKEGKVLEEGTHAQLIKLNGQYKKMLDLQSGF